MAKILSGKARHAKGGDLIEFSEVPDIAPLDQQISQEKDNQETQNLIDCVSSAICHMQEKDENPEAEEISGTFFSRWRNEAQFYSEPELQSLWGKILTEEICAPNSISLKTLDVIRNMTKDDALTFSTLCDYIIFGDRLLYCGDRDEINPEVSQSQFRKIVELGLLHYSEPIITTSELLKKDIDGKQWPYMAYGDYRLLVTSNKETPDIPYFRLTVAGRELYEVAKSISIEKVKKLCTAIFSSKSLQEIREIEVLKYVKLGSPKAAGKLFVSLFTLERPSSSSSSRDMASEKSFG